MTSPACKSCCQLAQKARSQESTNLAVMQSLCNITGLLSANDYEILCDATTGVPILLVPTFADDGSISAVNAYNLDGTAYVGDVTTLKSCDDMTAIDTAVHAEDTAHVSGDFGVQILSKRTDTAASSAVADGRYATLNTDSTGRLWTTTTVLNAAGASAVNIQDGGNSITVDGAVAQALSEGTGHYAAVAFGSIGAAYATLLTNAVALRYLKVQNATDAAVVISLDAGSTDFMRLGPGEKEVIDLAAAGVKVSTDISQKRESGAPTTGDLYVSAIS